MGKSNQSLLTEGNVGKQLLRFSIPFLLASLLQSMYGAADLFMVGHFASAAAVSGVSVGSQVMNTITQIFLGLTMGGTVLLGQNVGARQEKEAARTIGNVIALFGTLAVVLTVVLLFSTDLLVEWVKTPAEAVDEARAYIFTCSCGVFFIIGYNAVASILRGLGDSKTPLYFVAVACAVNIVGDYLLVGVLRMGALGAALATVLAQTISLVFAVLWLMKKGLPFPFSREDIVFDRKLSVRILLLGAPLALQQGLVSVSFLLITVITNTMGVVVSAAVGVVEKLLSFAFMIPGSVSAAVTSMSAQNIGAGKPERARKSLVLGIVYSLAVEIFVTAACVMFPETLTALITKDPEVIQAAALYLTTYSLDCVLVCFVFCFNGYFNGCGDTVFTMAHSLATTFLVRIPVAYLASRMPGATIFHVGLAAPMASLVSIVLCILYMALRKGKKHLQA